ncbi:2,3-diaminopropionate biosynthesis protein SbnA [Streptomyces sp. FXJ1.4098]|uniref:2,3-diaminopropionate biosynthesis protein SbnA n=1 Tax=Streptomyces sp. NPDC020845 TaxID=3365096 RepID=UPI00299785DA|nr:2,3-diaminopropionate biosynthesis protein SbnA [Streptomyces sp. FXJ1.4098]
MPIITTPQEFNEEDLFVDLREMFGYPLYLKCEGFNFAGSIKLKAAASMIEAAERGGLLGPESILVESSSGNLGMALSMIAAAKGYRFICVVDSRTNLSTRQVIESLGSEVHVITEPSVTGGFLGARLDFVRGLCTTDPRYVWLNQHANQNNWKAHYRTTAPAIEKQFPNLEVLFVGAGTTGTLMGCARYFKEQPNSPVTVVGIDSVGSVTFGTPAGPRMIPGLGAGVRPALFDQRYLDDMVLVPEIETIRTCHTLARGGFLFGGSTGTVVNGAVKWLAEHRPGQDVTAVAISPDLGDRYLDTIYRPTWVQDVYGLDALEPAPRPGAVTSGVH